METGVRFPYGAPVARAWHRLVLVEQSDRLPHHHLRGPSPARRSLRRPKTVGAKDSECIDLKGRQVSCVDIRRFQAGAGIPFSPYGRHLSPGLPALVLRPPIGNEEGRRRRSPASRPSQTPKPRPCLKPLPLPIAAATALEMIAHGLDDGRLTRVADIEGSPDSPAAGGCMRERSRYAVVDWYMRGEPDMSMQENASV